MIFFMLLIIYSSFFQEWNAELLANEQMYVEMEKFHLVLPNQMSKNRNDEFVDCLVGSYRKLNNE